MVLFLCVGRNILYGFIIWNSTMRFCAYAVFSDSCFFCGITPALQQGNSHSVLPLREFRRRQALWSSLSLAVRLFTFCISHSCHKAVFEVIPGHESLFFSRISTQKSHTSFVCSHSHSVVVKLFCNTCG